MTPIGRRFGQGRGRNFMSYAGNTGAYYQQMQDQFAPVTLHKNRRTSLSSVRFTDWVQPEIVIRAPKQKKFSSFFGSKQSHIADKKVSLEDLVKMHIAGWRRTYLLRGWDQFKAGEYRRACDTFVTADTISLDNHQERALVKLGMFYSGIASRQFSLATNSLKWLLAPSTQTGQLPDPDFLRRVGDLSSMYGIKTDLLVHARYIEEMTLANTKSPEAASIWAVMLLSQGNKNRALFQSKKVNELLASLTESQAKRPDVLAWSRLSTAMQIATERTISPAADKLGLLPAYWRKSTSELLPFEKQETSSAQSDSKG